MRKNIFLTLLLIILGTVFAKAQVTVGSGITPTRAALLDLKDQQTTGTVPSVLDNANITSTTGGLLLPRVKLVSPTTMEPFIPVTDADWIANTNSIKEKLAGLLVYNLTTSGILVSGICVWDGAKWTSVQPPLQPGTQPKAFTFYELGTEAPAALTFTASGGVAPIKYEWFRVTGSNIHVRVGTSLGMAAVGNNSYTPPTGPTGVIKGTTRNANNTGFYRYYCVATDASGQTVTSDIAEIAVGCGAKDINGEWISFMCFNLGATLQTISSQQNTSITFSEANQSDGTHKKTTNEETLYGDLFQWGRIADGHQNRKLIPVGNTGGVNATDNVISWNTASPPSFASGNVLGTNGQKYPYEQVATGDSYYGKFIKTIAANNYNWYGGANAQSTAVDLLWRTAAFPPNDPCQHILENGTGYSTFYPAENLTSEGLSNGNSGTAWRVPSQYEWASLYRGGTNGGNSTLALANTWTWYEKSASDTESVKGMTVKPDGVTTTLFLPASGYRNAGNGVLYHQGAQAYYWSSTVTAINAYYLNFHSSAVYPGNSNYRSYGFALRCVKNQ
jgi:uncharacterized protein (TIGR02145 family)